MVAGTVDELFPHSLRFDLHQKIRPLPPILIRPEESEDRLATHRQGSRRQIQYVNAEPGVSRFGVMRRLPVVDAPVDAPRHQQHDPQRLIARDAAGLVIESPSEKLSNWLLFQVPLHGLRRLIKNPAVTD